MVLDNKNSILRIKQSGLIYTLVFVAIVLVLLYIKKDPFKDFGISKSMVTIALVVLYTYFIVSRFIKDYNYFAFQDQENKIVFKYYSLRPFSKSRKTIEIEKSKFAGFKIEFTASKLRRHLILFQHSADGIRQFPKISVSAVSKKNLSTLSKILEKHIQQ